MKGHPSIYIPCHEEIGCKTPGSKPFFKFNSWTKEQNIICEKRIIRENGKFIALFTNAIVCFILLNLSDYFGRRLIIVFNSVVTVTSLLIAFVSQHFYTKMFFIGLAYGCEGTFSTLFVFLLNEVTSSCI